MHVPAPLQVHFRPGKSADGKGYLYAVARVDARPVSFAFFVSPTCPALARHVQFARAFLEGVCAAPMVSGVRA